MCSEPAVTGQSSEFKIQAFKYSKLEVGRLRYWKVLIRLPSSRYEDNGDAVNNLNVLVKNVKEASIKEFGDPKDFLEKINYLFGDQVFIGGYPSHGLQLPWGSAPSGESGPHSQERAVVAQDDTKLEQSAHTQTVILARLLICLQHGSP